MESLAPFIALALLLAALVVAINLLGRRLERHDDWLRMLDAQLNNLHKQRSDSWTRQLARPRQEPAPPPLVPPPLPPRAPTLNALDWSDDESATEDLMTRQTGRYPNGEPPKGPNDDD